MSIAELGSLGEFFASFGVLATLVYLVIQMRQNTQALRLNTAQVVTEELQQMFSLLASDLSLAEVFVEAGAGAALSAANKVRYYTFTSNILRVCENGYLQNRENAISPEHWEGIVRMMIDYSKMAAFEEYWVNRKHWMSREFQNFMDTDIIPLPAKVGISIPGNYTA
ncbi:MAG: hypothetical protein ACI9ON_003003 [Limisphaerales bacterium]|jgi:hypothetical protein